MAEMLARVSSRELTEWGIFYGLEPFGEERADLRSGVVASTIANVNREKKQKPYKPEDFLLFREKPKQSWEDQLRIVEMLNAAYGGQDLRKH